MNPEPKAQDLRSLLSFQLLAHAHGHSPTLSHLTRAADTHQLTWTVMAIFPRDMFSSEECPFP